MHEGVQAAFNTTSFGANPGNPYIVYKFGVFSKGPLKLPLFELDSRAVILNIACTPPPVAYFSWRSYLLADPALVFASLGDSLNHLVINTTGAGGSDVYRRTAALVTTGDAASYAALSAALAAAGLGNATNLDAIAPSLLPHPRASGFVMLHRASIWADPAEKAAYFASTNPIYLLTPPAAQPARPLPVAPLRPRGTGHAEGEIPGVVEGLATLRAGVLAAFGGLARVGLRVRQVTLVRLVPHAVPHAVID